MSGRCEHPQSRRVAAQILKAFTHRAQVSTKNTSDLLDAT